MAQQQVQTIEALENLAGIIVPENQKKEIQEILRVYPVKFSSHLLRLMKKSEAIRKQFLPNIIINSIINFANKSTLTTTQSLKINEFR